MLKTFGVKNKKKTGGAGHCRQAVQKQQKCQLTDLAVTIPPVFPPARRAPEPISWIIACAVALVALDPHIFFISVLVLQFFDIISEWILVSRSSAF